MLQSLVSSLAYGGFGIKFGFFLSSLAHASFQFCQVTEESRTWELAIVAKAVT